MTTENSYAQILKSSSIMGGAAGINLLLGMVRTKFSAVLIGTTGVGLGASFGAILGLIGILAGLGIQTSAVREVSAAVGQGDEQAIGRAVLTLRRICWLTGLTGMGTMMVLSPFISQLTFGNDTHTLDIVALGFVILFGNLAGGQMALIQGMRRIGDLARANIYGAIGATLAAIGFYAWLGLSGIVPALVSTAALQLALSWVFARRVPVPPVTLTWRQTWQEAGGMVRLGLVFMGTGLMASAVGYGTVTLITQHIDLPAVGLYSAAFALSGIFVNFVLSAMGADYYPRLTGVAHDHVAVNRLVNEQTEIGLLLAVPGLLATLALAPWIIRLFYTSEFLPAVELLQWFILGCLGRVISWPLGFVMLALGKGKWFFLTETAFQLGHLSLVAIGLTFFGLRGVATAFFVIYVGYTLLVWAVARHLTAFQWSTDCLRFGAMGLMILTGTFMATQILALWPTTLMGALVSVLVGVYSLRGLLRRVGKEHRVTQVLCKIPFIKVLCCY